MLRILATLILGFAIVVLTGNLLGCSTASRTERELSGDPVKFELIGAEERANYVAQSKVWFPTDIAGKDLLNGPQDLPGARRFDDRELNCRFVPKDPQSTATGKTPKFRCQLPSGEVVKIKYGSSEVHAEVAATRLFWALGFPADAVYPVDVNCTGCPVDPWSDEKNPQAMVRFSPALLEIKFPGSKLETSPESGWSFEELKNVNPSQGGASRAEVDALKLLSAFIQHYDNKNPNQRLVCPSNKVEQTPGSPPRCLEPVLMVQDLGTTFGASSLKAGDWKKMNITEWIGPGARVWDDPSQVPVWKKPKDCVANLDSYVRGTLTDPPISEEGRQFLIKLVDQLSMRQLIDLFAAARTELSPNTPTPAAQWAHWFKKKFADVKNHAPCSSR